MSLRPWPEVSRERLARFKIFDVVVARRTSPRTGVEHGFFLVETWDWVNVIALTEADELVLVRQYRHGPRAFTLEIPGGCIDPGEEPRHTAVRELREETGYATEAAPIHLGTVNPNPALFTNRCHTFLLTGCRKVGDLQPDPGEDLEVVTLPLAEVERRVAAGEIDHALVLNGLYFLRLHRG
jgi:8-oxo-dGTP pyrophosphatase MutT (NUDIX family)